MESAAVSGLALGVGRYASDGLDGVSGFRPGPADVGVVGSHSPGTLAVARTYTL